ncbi:MAG: hypothetical protein EAX96_07605 [Candidatus Lokiarchaeota archaeon]|nr:hypothetical protein [Candidatus Lokiarchaeota archaeon]
MPDIYLRYGISSGKKKDLLSAILSKYRLQSRADGVILYNKGNLLVLGSVFNSEVPDQDILESTLVRATVMQEEHEKTVEKYELKKYIGKLLTVTIEGSNGFISSFGYPELNIYIIFYFARPVDRGTEFGIIYKRLNDLISEVGKDLKSWLKIDG